MASAALRYTASTRLPMKPSHTPARTGVLRNFFASSNAVATTSALTCFGTTTSSSFMMFAGEKKCRPITSAGREMLARNRVDVEIRRVGGEHRAGLADAIEFGKHGLFHGDVFEHGFDHQIGVGECVVRCAAVPARHDGGFLFRCHAALGDQPS